MIDNTNFLVVENVSEYLMALDFIKRNVFFNINNFELILLDDKHQKDIDLLLLKGIKISKYKTISDKKLKANSVITFLTNINFVDTNLEAKFIIVLPNDIVTLYETNILIFQNNIGKQNYNGVMPYLNSNLKAYLLGTAYNKSDFEIMQLLNHLNIFADNIKKYIVKSFTEVLKTNIAEKQNTELILYYAIKVETQIVFLPNNKVINLEQFIKKNLIIVVNN